MPTDREDELQVVIEEQEQMIEGLLKAMDTMAHDARDRRSFMTPLIFLMFVAALITGMLLCHVSNTHGGNEPVTRGDIKNRPGGALAAP